MPPTESQAKLDAYNAAKAATVAAETTFREHHAVKDQALEDLVDGMKADLRYPEVAVREQPEKLSRLGWGNRRDASTLQSPGEVRHWGRGRGPGGCLSLGVPPERMSQEPRPWRTMAPERARSGGSGR